MRKHIAVGIGATLLLTLVYGGILTLAAGLSHALEQASSLWYLMTPLVVGFGMQAGLLSFIRQTMRERRAVATASVTATGGLSAGSMAACCAHHLTDVLPLIGLSGLAAFLSDYQVSFIIMGILSNIVGIIIMLETIQRHRLSAWVSQWKWNMMRVKRVGMAMAVIALTVTFSLNFLIPLNV